MKTKSLALTVLLLLFGTVSMTVAQAPAAQNTWNSGEPMPMAADSTAVAVLDELIYVVGGSDDNGTVLAKTQIYDPATDTWSTGVSLPTATAGGCAGVVNNVLYFVGGNTGGTGYTGSVWAYNPKTQTWSQKTAMPTARTSLACVVDESIIYAMGGYNGSFLATVESYDPATNSWASLASMSNPESAAGAGLIGSTILVTNGSDGEADGNNQAYSIATNTWRFLNSDPTLRQGTCVGAIGGRLYSAGGWLLNENGFTLTESFKLSTDEWKTLAPMPVGTGGMGRSATYKGQLYCFGGEDANGKLVGNVEVYQPYELGTATGIRNVVQITSLGTVETSEPCPSNWLSSSCFSIQQNSYVSLPGDNFPTYWVQNSFEVWLGVLKQEWYVQHDTEIFQCDSTGTSCSLIWCKGSFSSNCDFTSIGDKWTAVSGIGTSPPLELATTMTTTSGNLTMSLAASKGRTYTFSGNSSYPLPSGSSLMAATSVTQAQGWKPSWEPEIMIVGWGTPRPDGPPANATFNPTTSGKVVSCLRYDGKSGSGGNGLSCPVPWQSPGTQYADNAINQCASTGEGSSGLFWSAGEVSNPVMFQNPEQSSNVAAEGTLFVPAIGAGSTFSRCQAVQERERAKNE